MFTTAMGALNGTSYLNSAFDTGWLPAEEEDSTSTTLKKLETWTKSDSLTIAITGDRTSRYKPGMKIKLDQDGVTKYFTVLLVSYLNPYTNLTLDGYGVYTLSDSAITNCYYSILINPIGWPFGVNYIQGTNANGTWRKWADGTLECWGTETFTSVTSNLWGGSLYISSTKNVTWPISFAVIESANINVLARTPDNFIPALIEAASSYYGLFYFWKPASFTYDSITVGFYVKGRWQ